MKKVLVAASLLSSALFLITACGSSGTSYSLLGTQNSFSQNPSSTVNNKLDVLWVVDNSSSMDPLQQNLVTNFNSFINNFQTLGLDYNMAITTTDAYLSEAAFQNNPSLAKVRDGVGATVSGYFYITPLIPNIVSNFVTNATQGANGSGDERAFQSMFDTLNSPLNSTFRRAGAFFAVIILSDEDDFSDTTRPQYSWLNNGGIPDHDYANPNLPTIASVVSALDTMTSSTAANRNYNVSAISVLDSSCQASHVGVSPTTIIGQRYIDLANATNGVTGSICDANYASSLNYIQQQIISLTTQFKLTTVPDVSTIIVTVDGSTVPESSVNGWSYSTANNSIIFNGTAVPAASSTINVQFTPVSL
jgi:hypothetical protein